MRLFLLAAACCLLAASYRVDAQEEGLFARIATSEGMIRARLAYDKAPLTVSNFVGLIEGSQKAIDFQRGKLTAGSYYDGLTFHRVIGEFMIQTGSPAGDGTDGPGYTFEDEFHQDLAHDEAFVLSMANSGPNSNGSQFFITVAPTPWLNGAHSIFGSVEEGHQVVRAISEVSTDENDAPVSPVFIETITIERVGAGANAFQLDLAGLPKVGFASPRSAVADSGYHLELVFQPNANYSLLISPDLRRWTPRSIGFIGDAAPAMVQLNVTEFVAARSTSFFRVSEVHYPGGVWPPESLSQKTLDMMITQFGNAATVSQLSYTFTGPNSAMVKLGANPAVDVGSYFYRVDSPTRATLIVPASLPAPFDLPQFTLNFTSGSAGTFAATLPTAFPAPSAMAGTFSLNDL